MNDENEVSADAESSGPLRQSESVVSETKKKEENIPTEPEVLEFEFNEDGEEDLKKTLKKLRDDLKQCRKEKEEYLTGWQKERAEFANYKKAEDDRKFRLKEVMQEHILGRFLNILDSFNMAFANKEAWEKVDENWRKGVEYIYGQMNTIFEEYDVKPVGEVGEKFDPKIHQPIEMVPTDKKEQDHIVSSVTQKGYKLAERVIRPARVNVYEYREPQK